VDQEARAEIDTLGRLACLAANTVLVHGVGISAPQAAHVLAAGGSLVWCPSSNDFLFGQTARVRSFADARRLALGTDSRLSGQGDLLDELRVAATTDQLPAETLVRTVTIDAARLLRLDDAGRLARRGVADLTILRRRHRDPYQSIVTATRGDVVMTMIDGKPMFATPDMQPAFTATKQRCVAVCVDGSPRLLADWVAVRARRMRVTEPGLQVGASW
jgi:cytosine/adenosine deaminase-related metal-dependent hydrolase